MDTFVDSSWYFLRYLDPKNPSLPFAKPEADAWMPVDLYIGGIEHATAHLVYARYFHKVLRDLGMVSCKEPFKKLICQGMVLKDGSKMSKSKGNTVDPDEVIERYGADALRVFMTFAAPIEKEIDWTGFEGIEGATRFLKRVARFVDEHCERYGGKVVSAAELPTKADMNEDERRFMHKLNGAVKHVTDDLGVRFQFNTVVSSLMELANDISALPKDAPNREALMGYALCVFVRLMSPVAPHLAEQLWEQLGGKGFCMRAEWPDVDASWLETDEQLLIVQINGKVRGRVMVSAGADSEERKKAAMSCLEARPYLDGKEIKKVIVPPGGKLVSFVI
jgi:leucyl-tRNA synthetase